MAIIQLVSSRERDLGSLVVRRVLPAASSRERIALAKDRWAKGQFMPVPGETEFILPLPSE
jgi:hypothetical protein